MGNICVVNEHVIYADDHPARIDQHHASVSLFFLSSQALLKSNTYIIPTLFLQIYRDKNKESKLDQSSSDT